MKKEIKEGNKKQKVVNANIRVRNAGCLYAKQYSFALSFSLICPFACLCRAKIEWFSDFHEFIGISCQSLFSFSIFISFLKKQFNKRFINQL